MLLLNVLRVALSMYGRRGLQDRRASASAAGIGARCEQMDVDRFGRIVATYYDNQGFSINRNMVYTGWALAYRRYSTRYVATEDGARVAKRGLWKGEFVQPWEWRKANQ